MEGEGEGKVGVWLQENWDLSSSLCKSVSLPKPVGGTLVDDNKFFTTCTGSFL